MLVVSWETSNQLFYNKASQARWGYDNQVSETGIKISCVSRPLGCHSCGVEIREPSGSKIYLVLRTKITQPLR